MAQTDSGDFTFSGRLEILPGNTVVDRINNAKNFGFNAISVPGRYLEEYLPGLREILPDSPLPVVAISLGFIGSLASPRANIRRRCRDSLLKMFDICSEVGARFFNMPPVLIQDNTERMSDPGSASSLEEAQDALLFEQLPLIGDEAKARDVTLLLEPVNRFESEYLNSVIHAARLCETLDHDHIGLTCDFFHMQIEELSVEQSITKAGKWVKLVHIAENTRVEPGPGSMNFTPGFRALKRIGYGGVIELECRNLSGAAEEVLPRSVDYIRNLWNDA